TLSPEACIFVTMRPLNLLLLCSLALHSFIAQGQNDSTAKPKRLRISPLPVIYYSPETRLGFGALVAANFETTKHPDTLTKSSYAQTYFIYTVNHQYDWGTSTRIYMPENKFVF